jgi:hypothetical protein
MKKYLIIILSFITVAALAQGQEEHEVLSLAKKKFRWMTEAKLDSLKDLLDDRLTYTHSNGWVQTKKEFLDDFSNGKLVYYSIDIQEIKARVYSGAAIVNCRGKFTTTINGGTKVTFDLMVTETYVLLNKKWKLASRHANKMQ